MNDGPLLLDTHYWIWMEGGFAENFSRSGLAAIQTAADNGMLLVSVISVWEVGILESKRRVQFPMDCESWVRQALAAPGLTVVPLSVEIALASTRLPEGLHADPADRILVATARHMRATLMTRDKKLIEYGRRRHVSVMQG